MIATTRRGFLCAGLGATAAPYVFAQSRRDALLKNVLFLVVDDLRPMLGCYGYPDAVTPNIDRLARRGVTFLNNHCQLASDGPSRQSLFTGSRPGSTGVFYEAANFRASRPNAVTLPQYFRHNGYHTTSIGRVFNGAASWDEADGREPTESNAHSWKVSSRDLFDGQTSTRAVDALKSVGDRKFFLAVGFERPSLPFAAPKEYFDLHQRAYVKSLQGQLPEGAPEYAVPAEGELRGFTDISGADAIDGEVGRDLVRAYMASVSYVDAQVGVVLRALEEQGLWQDTTIVLCSDSGFHLGEHGLWGKNSVYEVATRTPLIISSFGRRGGGRKTRALTELVDVYPSVCELAGLPIPGSLDGASTAPLFGSPDRLWKRAVFSQQPREIPVLGPGMGYSMRTDRYRYTEWSAFDSPYKTTELYDYKHQPLEMENLANDPKRQTLANGLSAMMREGPRAAKPPKRQH